MIKEELIKQGINLKFVFHRIVFDLKWNVRFLKKKWKDTKRHYYLFLSRSFRKRVVKRSERYEEILKNKMNRVNELFEKYYSYGGHYVPNIMFKEGGSF